MADNQNTTTTTSTTNHETSNSTNHLGTEIPSGNMDNGDNVHSEKQEFNSSSKGEKKPVNDDDDEEEDMDALIDELESQDGGAGQEEEEEAVEAGEAPPVPDELLQTDTRMGLTEHEVTTRRKKFGLNQMKEDKENLVLKFLGYFVGPIQFVMEVSFLSSTHCGYSAPAMQFQNAMELVPLTTRVPRQKSKTLQL